MPDAKQLTMAELEMGLNEIRRSPNEAGTLELIVRRPRMGQREVLNQGELCLIEGLRGDNWKLRPSTRTSDGSAHPDMQLNIMNARAIALIAQAKDRWQLAGDQLFIDMDLGAENLPPGTRLAMGSAIVEVTDQPHTGCKKFVAQLRTRCDAVRQLRCRQGATPARHQCQGRAARRNPCWRHGNKNRTRMNTD